jgi:hypothetical protein
VGSDPDHLIEMNKDMESEGFCSQVAYAYWVVAYTSLAKELDWTLNKKLHFGLNT